MNDSNLTELERRVAHVLHDDANMAMSSTDTETRYSDFVASTASSVRRRRVIWGAGAVAGAAAVVAAIALAGHPSRHAGQPAGPSPRTSESPLGRPYQLAAAPLLTQRDWVLTAPDDAVLVRSHARPPRLTTCITSPLTWQARQSRVATYVPPTNPAPVWTEYVLRFDDPNQAHQAVTRVRQQMADCPTPPKVFADQMGSRAFPASRTEWLEEWFAAQRTTFTTASPGDLDMPVGMYALRVARRGNVVVVLEDEGYPTDRATVILTTAIQRAIAGE